MSDPSLEGFGALPSANGRLTRLAYAYAMARGVDLYPLLKKANLTVHQIEDPLFRLMVRDQIRFVNLTAAALDDELFGFHLARSIDLRELGLLYYASASAEMLRDTLQTMARYTSAVNEGLSLKYFDDKYVGITFHYVGVSRYRDRHQIEFFVTLLVRLCRQLTGLDLVPAHIRHVHPGNDGRLEFAQFFGGSVEFGAAADEVAFFPAIKDTPIVGADPYLNKLLTRYCEEALARRSANSGAFRSAVENAIVPLLPHGRARLEEIALRLGLSERTIVRRLASEKLTFSDVLQSLRVDLAERYLADQALSISQIAWLLGYREVSSFTHAFKRWTGATPRDARSPAASR